MDGADVCRTSSRASRHPPDVISTTTILNPRWRRRKWRHPEPGARFSILIAAAAQDGGPSASGRHLGWPHLREPEMRSSKMAAGSGRAAILRRRRNRDRKTRPILLSFLYLFFHDMCDSCQFLMLRKLHLISYFLCLFYMHNNPFSVTKALCALNEKWASIGKNQFWCYI